VVVRIGVAVQQARTAGGIELGEEGGVTSFGDVDDALECGVSR
jgi:hypothetical protein